MNSLKIYQTQNERRVLNFSIFKLNRKGQRDFFGFSYRGRMSSCLRHWRRDTHDYDNIVVVVADLCFRGLTSVSRACACSQVWIRRQRHVVRSVRHRRDHGRHPSALEVDIAGKRQIRAERDRRGRRRLLRQRRGHHTHQHRGRGSVHHRRQRQQTGVQGVRQVQPQSGRRRPQRQPGAQGMRTTSAVRPAASSAPGR